MYRISDGSSLRSVVVGVVIAASLGIATSVVGGEKWQKVTDPAERLYDETFQLEDGARLELEVGDFDVELIQGSSKEARVEVYVRHRSRDKAEDYFDQMRFRARLIDNDLIVETRRRHFSGSWWQGFRNVSGTVVVTIPAGTEMDVATSDGDVRSESLRGVMRIATSDGDIIIAQIDGEDVRLRTSDGDISVDSMNGQKLSAVTTDGDVTIKSVEGKYVTLKSSDGDIIVDKARAEDVKLRTSDGDIRIDIRATKLGAKTSDGNIRVSIHDDIEMDLRTSDGDIFVDAVEGLRADVRLRGERVRVLGEIAIKGDISRRRIVGTIKGGGPQIVATTSDGEVSLDLRGRKK
jgi:hypothetical protein